MKRVGFIVNSRVPGLASLRKGMPPHALAFGWDDAGSPMSFMRFRAIAEALRGSGWHYELYRPWRRYDAVVFLKAMGPHCLALAKRLRERGVRVVFEANVDYYTRFEGEARLDAMAPTASQRADAVAITEFADAVIASSRHLAGVCAEFNPRSAWVPDNVNLRLRPARVQREPFRDGRLQIWWSGMAAKLFEFLAAEEAFLALADRIHLGLVTDDLERAKSRWPVEVRDRLERFLGRVPHTLHRFRDIAGLLGYYAEGGVIVSPRFLDVPYNLSHTEWKITLGMACELPAVASPVPSYLDTAERSAEGAVTICRTSGEWRAALESFLEDPARLREAGRAAFETVRQHYETGAVARQHAACLAETCARP
jgi:glycosyltransferase involved in cell wall biosynthesis